MLRIVLFLVLIALAGAGAAWVADQPGDVVLTWGGFRASPSFRCSCSASAYSQS